MKRVWIRKKRMKMPQLAEHSIQGQAIEYLALAGYMVWRNNVGAMRNTRGGFVRFGQVGSGDIFAIKDGQFYSIEVKQAKGEMTQAQEQWMGEVRKFGGHAFVIRSLEELIDKLREETQKKQ